jgi:geranylgeranyl reductase
MRKIVIIGGGPAGAHAACGLGESGFEVTVFEPRTRFEKACGGGIPARGIQAYPFLDDTRLPARRIENCRILSPSDRESLVRLKEPLLVFSRADLHGYQLSRAIEAGAIVQRARVTGFDRGTHGWNVAATTGEGTSASHGPFDFLVAADGASGIARRRLAPDRTHEGLAQGIGYFLPGLFEPEITLKFFRGLEGYLWVFPRPDHASAGICGRLGATSAESLRGMMDGFLRARYGGDILRECGRYAALIPGAPREPGGSTLSGEGWAAIGDAGCCVDPLTREGIYFALRSADCLVDALRRGRPEDYTRDLARDPGRELAWAARHARGFHDAGFIERLVALCGRSRTVETVLSDLINGRQPYRTLKRRLLVAAPVIGWQALRRRRPRQAGAGVTPARGNRSTDRSMDGSDDGRSSSPARDS